MVRFAETARDLGLPTIFGTEMTLGLDALGITDSQCGVADPRGEHLVVLAEGPKGYAALARTISAAQMAGSKGAPRADLGLLGEHNTGSWFVLTGCRKGAVPAALVAHGPAGARRELDRLIEVFGTERVLMELWDRGDPLDRHRNDALARIAVHAGVGFIATGNVHYAAPSRHRLAAALAAVRAGRSLDELDGWLPAAPLAHLRAPLEQIRRFARWPGAIERTVEIAQACAFDLRLAAPGLPVTDVPDGYTEMGWLRELVRLGAQVRYPESHSRHQDALVQLDYELGIIEQLGFAGYFLVVREIVDFCNAENIYCQGRGSAANSAVCYALGITPADAVSLGLLFERFLSPARDGPPDIDIDIEHHRREEVIQHVYTRYGREHAAQVANVITYRQRSAIKEMAKACGISANTAAAIVGDDEMEQAPPVLAQLAKEVVGFPRHLGIHSGGMVLADRPLTEVCPIEWARMPGRSVLQWDKDDCAAVGLVKFDLLGLGMLTVLHRAVDLVREHRGVEIDLATIPQEDVVYDLLCAADTVGVFQVESRAQMATLPRLKPRCFYDLVIEVALIRPGPIQGNAVHPYLRRRAGTEPVTYPHPLLEPTLRRTLGIPIFQEQLMQMAIDIAGFSPTEADQLRQAMAAKRSRERMSAMKVRLLEGMAVHGVVGDQADSLVASFEAFANFGFPESHSVSFAYIVYSSAWLKVHYPTELTAALLDAQPMGFWSPYSIVRDARRHGVKVRGPDVHASGVRSRIEQRSSLPPNPAPSPSPSAARISELLLYPRPGIQNQVGSRGTVRLGLSYVRGLSRKIAARIDAEANQARFTGLEDFVLRTGASVEDLEILATAGAFEESLGLTRRDALWAAGAMSCARPDRLPGLVIGADAPCLPGMNEAEELAADLWSTGLSPERYPTEFVRDLLAERGVLTAADLRKVPDRTVVEVAGVVTHRQQPGTAKGVMFINLEDETGFAHVVCSPGAWARFGKVARGEPALWVRGIAEQSQGVTNVRVHRMAPLRVALAGTRQSRDFR